MIGNLFRYKLLFVLVKKSIDITKFDSWSYTILSTAQQFTQLTYQENGFFQSELKR